MSSFSDAADPKLLLQEYFLANKPSILPREILGNGWSPDWSSGQVCEQDELGKSCWDEVGKWKWKYKTPVGIKTEAQCDDSP